MFLIIKNLSVNDIRLFLFLYSFSQRTLRPFEGSKENDLKFGIGEVLHVTNTFINLDKNKSQWQWYAEKVAKTSTESDKGYVPRLDT